MHQLLYNIIRAQLSRPDLPSVASTKASPRRNVRPKIQGAAQPVQPERKTSAGIPTTPLSVYPPCDGRARFLVSFSLPAVSIMRVLTTSLGVVIKAAMAPAVPALPPAIRPVSRRHLDWSLTPCVLSFSTPTGYVRRREIAGRDIDPWPQHLSVLFHDFSLCQDQA
ncbi:hypothetical protein TPAR_05283 [Tolypocladium paradoxum]|uniref:Uncharacterized protein n=1 Tax=Tolypocladium paradoxum TaxID=94208 RepID=A0A2S4KWD3_9HYPO|nr:hypothetical protein TPAR_05283 [Tolypocladium paradoxum]